MYKSVRVTATRCRGRRASSVRVVTNCIDIVYSEWRLHLQLMKNAKLDELEGNLLDLLQTHELVRN